VETVIKDIHLFLESKKQEQLQFLINICNQNSYSFNRSGVEKVATMIQDQMMDILPIHETDPQPNFGDHHLYRTKGEQKSIYLVGHIDTVFPPDHPFQTCRIDHDILHGPGTGDMKGGLTVIIYALKALQHVGLLKDLPISVIFNSDEEVGSKSSGRFFEREREKALICLVTECAGLNNEIVISRNGKLGARIQSHGETRHVGSGTHEKSSAILEIAHKIIALEALNNSVPDFSLNIGKIEGGLGPATIPSEATGYIDMRWKDDAHKNIILKKIEEIMAVNHQPDCSSEFKILNGRPAMPDTGRNNELIELLKQTGEELGQQILTEHRRGTSDANFFGPFNIPTLDGLGPLSDHDHTENEYIQISSLFERTLLLAVFILNYAKSISLNNGQ
jgi:glutamate carboxypeptidase